MTFEEFKTLASEALVQARAATVVDGNNGSLTGSEAAHIVTTIIATQKIHMPSDVERAARQEE